MASVGVFHSSVGGCRRPWAGWWLLSLGAVCCGRWVIVCGHRVTLLWVGGLLFVGGGCHCGCWVFVGAGSLFADPGLWFVGNGARMLYMSFVGGGWLFVDGLFVGGLFVDWVVVCGGSGAMSCVVCSWLAKSDGTSGGRVLTVIRNLNNDERRHRRRSSFGCHVAESDVAPGNPLALM